MGPKKFWVHKKFWVREKCWKKVFKKIGPKTFWVWKKIESGICCVRKKIGLKNLFEFNEIAGPKSVGPKNVGFQKILDLQKFGPRKFCSIKCMTPKKFGLNQTYKSWDIDDIDKCCKGICCLDKCHFDSKYLLSGQMPLWQLVSFNSWENPDMNKCRQDICCLEKYHNENWHLLKIVLGTYF